MRCSEHFFSTLDPIVAPCSEKQKRCTDIALNDVGRVVKMYILYSVKYKLCNINTKIVTQIFSKIVTYFTTIRAISRNFPSYSCSFTMMLFLGGSVLYATNRLVW